MRKYLVIAAVVCAIAAQFYRPTRDNPPADEKLAIEASLKVPPEIRGILDRSCADCHSHRTAWPWYSNISPVSWLLADHVREGREHVNFSNWPGRHKPVKLLEEMCEEVEKDAMPLGMYVRLHRDSRLSEADKRTFCAWTKAEAARIGAAGL